MNTRDTSVLARTNYTTQTQIQERGERAARRKRRLINSGGYPMPPMPLTRKMARSVARHNMEKAGITRINKGFFAGNWRKWVHKK